MIRAAIYIAKDICTVASIVSLEIIEKDKACSSRKYTLYNAPETF